MNSATTQSNSKTNQLEANKYVMMKNENRLGPHGEEHMDENDAYKASEKGTSEDDNNTAMNGANGAAHNNATGNGDTSRTAVSPNGGSPQNNDHSENRNREDGGVSSSANITNNIQGEIKAEKNNGDGKSNAAPVLAAPVPLLKGMLTYIDNELTRKHTITGMWNFESSTESPPQTFQLARNLGPDEDPKELPKDGEFQGSFKVSYTSVGSNGKTKSRTRLISESGVKLTFIKQVGKDDMFDIKGKGTNQYGVFNIFGTAERDKYEKDKAYRVILRKKYITTPDAAGSTSIIAPPLSTKNKSKSNKGKKRKLAATSPPAEKHEGPLPDPSESYPANVVCLRGKVTRDSSVQDGVVHNVAGLWSTGLDLILSDPKNEHGFCNQFEYEHRSTVDTDVFPISGRYTGWFHYTEDGKKTRYTERDVILKFKMNNAGYYNVEGRGTNIFGKYNITGTLDKENIITLFRHFVPIKPKKAAQPPTSTALGQQNGQRSKFARISLDDVIVPDQATYDQIVTPTDGEYQAISRGILKLNDDGSHTCSGKWAQSRSHHNTNATSNFTFGLEEHHAKQAAEDMKKKGLLDIDKSKPFPLDSANYKGSFKMKKGTAKLQPVIDQQLVMKFRKNTKGSYNVYGKGVNVYGKFDLLGVFVQRGPHSGNVELFRVYEPMPEAATAPTPSLTTKAKALPLAKNAPVKKASKTTESSSSGPGHGLVRRESSRQTKLPSHLADDNPEAQKARLMDKCMGILKIIQEKDASGGRYFLEPVDPVAHGIPTYHEIITNPMDLGTIQVKMEANEIESPDDFARLVRLVFENAVKFNTNPMNYVHQNARDLLAVFNKKFRDVERLVERHVEKKKPTKAELKEIKRKHDKEEKRLEKEKKRKREEEEDPKMKHLSLLKESAEEVNKPLQALLSFNVGQSSEVSRDEFNMMTDTIRKMNMQMQHVTFLLQQLLLPETASSTNASKTTPTETDGLADANPAKKKKRTKTQTKAKQSEIVPAAPPISAAPEPQIPVPDPTPLEDDEPLTHEEQEELTNAINEMSNDESKIMKVIDIIKKSKKSSDLIDDDQEIELDLDQLDTATQRKLLKFVNKVSKIIQKVVYVVDRQMLTLKYMVRINQNQRGKRIQRRKVILPLLRQCNRTLLLAKSLYLRLRQRVTILLSSLGDMIVIVMKKMRFKPSRKKIP